MNKIHIFLLLLNVYNLYLNQPPFYQPLSLFLFVLSTLGAFLFGFLIVKSSFLRTMKRFKKRKQK